MSVNQPNQVAYGLSQPLINVFPIPIVSLRVPTTADKAQIGTVWVYTTGNAAYVLTSIVNNQGNWQNISGGSGSFTNLVVSGTSALTGAVTMGSTLGVTGLITATAGVNVLGSSNVSLANGNVTTVNGNIQSANGEVTAGAQIAAGTTIQAGTTITAGTGITSTTGNIVASVGNLIAGGAVSAGSGVVTVNGAGADLTTNPGLSLTSTLNIVQGAGTLVVKSTTANSGNNNGFIQVWIGGGVGRCWIPYWTNTGIAP